MRLQKLKQQQLQEAQKKQARSKRIKIVSATMAVVLVAAVVVLVLDPLGLFPGTAGEKREPGSLVNGDWISYAVTDLQNGAQGTLKMTYSNVTDNECTITYVLSLNGKTNTTSQDLKTENGNWSSAASGAIGPYSSGDWMFSGKETNYPTAFGNETATHYYKNDSLGTMDIWTSQDNMIAYKLEYTATASTEPMIFEIEDTSLTYEK